MAAKRPPGAAASPSGGSCSVCLHLDDDSMAAVFREAKEVGALGSLATTNQQLCSLARSRMPGQLSVSNAEEASLVMQSNKRGRPAFSGCTSLALSATDVETWMLTPGVRVLIAAQQWPAMQHLKLDLYPERMQLQPDTCLDDCASGVLYVVSALQQLRSMELRGPTFGTSCALQASRLQQLTSLTLAVMQSADPNAAADLSPLSRMTNLVRLEILDSPSVQLPAGPEGPFSLPSSLTHLSIGCMGRIGSAGHLPWSTHLAACPHLRTFMFGLGLVQQQVADDAAGIAQLLAQHNQQLRTLHLATWQYDPVDPPPFEEWQPDASLAALAGLERLHAGGLLAVKDQGDWQHLAQLTALTGMSDCALYCAPAAVTMPLLRSLKCKVALGGRDIGCVLLACPALEEAHVEAWAVPQPVPGQQDRARLSAHPRLQTLILSTWPECDGVAAAAQWAALAPVLGSLQKLHLKQWPRGSSSYADNALPDMSACTALTDLYFECSRGELGPQQVAPQLEAFASMLAPLVQLRSVSVEDAPGVNARVALLLQSMLPELRWVSLNYCGALTPGVQVDPENPFFASPEAEQAEEQLLLQVKKLLRHGVSVSSFMPILG